MKIRKGLVSNSSSNSFTCLVRKEAYDKTCEKVHDYVKAVVESVSAETTVFGVDAVCIETYSSSGEPMWDWHEVDYDGEIPKDKWDEEMYEEEAVNTFLALIADEDIWSTTQDW